MDRIEQAYREHIDAARRFAYLACGDMTMAEDLAHEAFLKCSLRAHRVRDPDRFRWYLLRAVARANIDRHRAAHSRVRREKAVAGTEVSRLGVPEAVVARLDVMTALDRLPTNQRIIVVLRFWLGYPVDDIARLVGSPAGTVKSRLSRALDQLEVMLRDD